MKRLSDYKGDEAIELWADIMEPLTAIFKDEEVANVTRNGNPPLMIAKEILKNHKHEATSILLRIDDRPINAVNLFTRLLGLINDFMTDEDAKVFFVSQSQQTVEESSGSATENTEEA